MYHLLGDYKQALGHFELALREEPEMIVPNLFMGMDLLALHEPQKAVRYLQRAQRLNPHDEPTVLGLGRAYTALREFPRLETFFLENSDSARMYAATAKRTPNAHDRT